MFRYRNLMLLLCLLVISACSLNSAAAQSPTPPPLPTDVPPLPKLTYTEIESTEPLPFVLQRFPRRGEELAPDGVIELVFDRPMNPTATAGAFTLQQAAQSPTPISGEVTWPNAQTLRFTPKSPLNRETIYDVILTQKAIDSQGLALVEPFTFRFNTQGYLTVTQVMPKAETQDVETNATITVMFNRPVVPLTSLAEADKFPQPLDFDPPLPGQGEWLNTSIYVFKPSETMAGGTTYTARVKKGLADAAQEATLSTDFTWQFTTQPPQAVWNTPNDGATLVGIETPIQITFNQPIDLKSAQERFSLTAGFVGNLLGSSLDGQLTVDGATLTFTPTERLEFDTTYQVTLEAGVTSATGGQGSKETTSYSFTTVPLPQIIGTDPSNGTQTAYPYTSFTIRFNTPVSPATIMPHVSMEPPLPITPTEVYTYYSPWDNSFTFHFGAKPSTDYEVRITPGISDPYGNKTSEDLTVKFRTDQLDPTYQLLTAGFVGMYDAGLPAKMLVQYTNINQINLKLYQLKENEIFKPEYEWQDYVMSSNAIQRTWTVNLEAPLNKISYQPIDLVENGGKLAPGLYLLEVDSPQIQQDYNRRRRHVLLVTETGLTLKAGVRDMLVWATDLATGQPKANQKNFFL